MHRRGSQVGTGGVRTSVFARAWLFLLFAILSFPEGAFAQGSIRRPIAPTLAGTPGLIRTVSAQAHPVGSLSFGLHAEFFTAEGFTFPNTTTTRTIADLSGNWVPYSFEVQNQRFFTDVSLKWLASAVKFEGNNTLPIPPPELIQVSALELYLRAVRTQADEDQMEPHSFGLGLGLLMPSKVDEIGIDFGQTSVEIDALYTWDMAAQDEEKPPVRLHANLGYFLANISSTEGFFSTGNPDDVSDSNTILRFAFGQSVFDQLRIRLGAEYVHRRFTPFLEWNMNSLLEFPDEISFLDSPQWLTPGLRIRPTPDINITLAAEIALVQAAHPEVSVLPDWNLIIGLAYTHIPTPPPPPPPLIEPKERPIALITTGKVSGVVYDANTNQPLAGAVLSFPGRDLTSLITAETGAYTTYDLQAGPVEIRVDRTGYLSRSASPVVVAGQTVTQDFYLVPQVVEPEKGTFRGTVQSLEGEFLAAKVSLFGTEESRTTEKGAGAFLFELPAAEYRATAEAVGYFPETFPFSLAGGQVLIHDFVLKKKPELKKKKFVEVVENRIQISQMIYFATGKATILEQSFPVLREIADVLKENPHLLLVEIQGHTDSRGKDDVNKKLSQNRADSVRNFLVKEGVESARLTAVGYGEEVPIVFPDDTKEKQARNRRVEFIILKQGTP
ncbi:MAG: OmpA family protein [Bdellovibrionota bacterium]